MGFVTTLTQKLQDNANTDVALPMAKYMKNLFPFLGIKTEVRRGILKEAIAQHKDEIKANYRQIAQQLFTLPKREYHYCAIDILLKEWPKHFVSEDIKLIEEILVTHSWWDSVDPMAKYLVGGYLKQYPDMTDAVIKKFAASGNMWLNRSAITFQLGYKKETDLALLFSLCENFSTSREFFIQKAIGWALREHAKTNPQAVRDFVTSASLKPLSIREALKNI